MSKTKAPAINKSQLGAIVSIARRLIEGHTKTINKYRQIPKSWRPDWVEAQILYCEHCVSALKHLIEVAKQQHGGQQRAQNHQG